MAVTIRVLLVDDEVMIRVGLRMVLTAEPDLEVVGEACDGAVASTMAAQLRPDIVLMDVRMPHVDGIEGARRVLEASPESRVIVLTTFGEDEYVEGALRAGARDSCSRSPRLSSSSPPCAPWPLVAACSTRP
jgi:YesN/AraC family two-component response regulator